MIKVVQGNILNCKEDIIGHQVNCQGVMGSGLAKQLRTAYSNLYPSYKQYCKNHAPHQLLGKCHVIRCGSKVVANLYGQLNYGRGKTRYTDYDALKAALYELKQFSESRSLSVALPYKIGCGLANGEWNVVESIINEVYTSYEVTLYKQK